MTICPTVSAAQDVLADEVTPFGDSLLEQFHAQRFTELEQVEAELRTSKARFTGGDWKLFHFYEVLSGSRIVASTVAINSDWTDVIARLEEWKAASPRSGVVSLLLASALKNYAWFARGTAEDVKEWNRGPFKDRLNKAAFYLNDSRRLLPDNPHWYVTWLVVGRGLGWDRERVQSMFAQAMDVEPLYQHAYTQMAVYLLPRWYGAPGDWIAFAQTSTSAVGGNTGEAIYNHIVVMVSDLYGNTQFFDEHDVSWWRIEASLDTRERLWGPSRHAVNSIFRLAGGLNDKIAARRYLKRIGESWEPATWRTRQAFDAYVKWVNSNN